MLFTSRIDEAIKLATHLHRNQTRKDILHTPYASHLLSVGMMLAQVTNDEEVIIAGLMHDSLEDVPDYTMEKLIENCGERVAIIVKHVTEPLDANRPEDDQMPWLERKETYLENLKEGGPESAMVSAADKIHNIESLISDLKKEGKVFLDRFHSSTRNQLWFYEQVLMIVEDKIGKEHALSSRLLLSIGDFKNVVAEYEND